MSVLWKCSVASKKVAFEISMVVHKIDILLVFNLDSADPQFNWQPESCSLLRMKVQLRPQDSSFLLWNGCIGFLQGYGRLPAQWWDCRFHYARPSPVGFDYDLAGLVWEWIIMINWEGKGWQMVTPHDPQSILGGSTVVTESNTWSPFWCSELVAPYPGFFDWHGLERARWERQPLLSAIKILWWQTTSLPPSPWWFRWSVAPRF